MKAVGCHVYTGGFSAGVADHFEIAAHFETDSPVRKYQKSAYGLLTRRFPGPVHVGEWPDLDFVPDLMYGNPPCSLWSRLGKKHDPGPRLQCLAEFLGAVTRYRPRIAVFETLRSFDLHGVLDLLSTLYPEVHRVSHDVKFLGLAQARPRDFVVGSSVRLTFPAPTPTKITVAEALADMTDPGYYEETPIEWIAPWAMGGRISKNFKVLYPEPTPQLRHPSFARRRLEPDRVSYCLTKAIYMYHYEHPRVLGTNEVCRLMGFPEHWDWPKDARQWMCKGVTPNAGRYMAGAAAEALKSSSPPVPGRYIWDYASPTGRRGDFRIGGGLK